MNIMINHRPRKRFSQNFLKDPQILKKIATTIDLTNQKVIEIGPGKGALTQFLTSKAKEVVAFEIDLNLFEHLNQEFASQTNLTVVNQDFLKADLSSYQGFQIVANIPYHISTDILFKVFQYYQNFEHVILLVQKEFGQRVCASVGTKNYSKLAPSVQLFYEAQYCFDVSNNAFWPKPKVTSALIHLKRKKEQYDVDYQDFLNFMKKCFAMRRKTLWNNLKNEGFDGEIFIKCCQIMGVEQNVRPEHLTFKQFLFLYQELKIQ